MDFNELKTLYNNKWKNIKDLAVIAELNKHLQKVGLQLKKDKIEIICKERWEQVSIISRSKYKMPSCTNQLESTHGHLNSFIPRRNLFWPLVQRIISSIILKCQNFKKYCKHNYERYQPKIKIICKNTPNQIMEQMIRQYKTDLKTHSCKYGEANLLSSMLDVQLPCSNLFYMGVPFPEIETPELQMNNLKDGDSPLVN